MMSKFHLSYILQVIYIFYSCKCIKIKTAFILWISWLYEFFVSYFNYVSNYKNVFISIFVGRKEQRTVNSTSSPWKSRYYAKARSDCPSPTDITIANLFSGSPCAPKTVNYPNASWRNNHADKISHLLGDETSRWSCQLWQNAGKYMFFYTFYF